jgi:hypothetical protein
LASVHAPRPAWRISREQASRQSGINQAKKGSRWQASKQTNKQTNKQASKQARRGRNQVDTAASLLNIDWSDFPTLNPTEDQQAMLKARPSPNSP